MNRTKPTTDMRGTLIRMVEDTPNHGRDHYDRDPNGFRLGRRGHAKGIRRKLRFHRYLSAFSQNEVADNEKDVDEQN